MKWKEELAEKTTIHGLKEVLTEQHKYMRPAWLFIFFMAVGSTTYYVWNVIGEYNLDPTATKVRNEMRSFGHFLVGCTCLAHFDIVLSFFPNSKWPMSRLKHCHQPFWQTIVWHFLLFSDQISCVPVIQISVFQIAKCHTNDVKCDDCNAWACLGPNNLFHSQVKIMRLDSYEYPVMLFCPDTWLDAGKALSFNISIPGLQYALGFLINFGVNRPPYKIEDYDKAKSDFEDWWYAEGNPFSNLDEFFKHIAVDAERFKRDCSYCDHPQLDQNSLFAKVTMNEGVCYNISMPSIDGRVALGDLDYLHIEMPFLSTNYLTRKSYWKFIVHPDPSLGMSDTHYLQVFPHHSNTIRVMLHHFKSLPNDYCITLEAALSKNYSQSSCVADCFVSSKSQCHPLPMIRKDAMPKNVSNLCNTAQQVAMNKVEETLSHYEEELNVTSGEEPAIQDIPDQCVRECPSVCEKWVYESSVEAHKSTAEEGMTSFHFLNQVIHYGGIISHEEVQT